MKGNDAYKITLVGEIFSSEGRIFFTKRGIENGKYTSHIMELGDKLKQVTSGVNEHLPAYRDGMLYYVRYDEKGESLMKMDHQSEPIEVARFRKIKKFIVMDEWVFVIASENEKNDEPFITTKIKYRFNGVGLFRSRYALYKIGESISKIYSGNFDVEDIQSGKNRIVIKTTENMDDYGMADLYEIDKDGNKLIRITEKSLVINGFAVSDSGKIALSGHIDLDPWEINTIIYPEEGKTIKIANDSYDSVLSDLFFTSAYKIKFYGDDLYCIGQKESSSNIYRVSGNTVSQITEIDGKIIDFDIVDDGKLVYTYTDATHPSIIKYKTGYNFNEGINPSIADKIALDGGEVFFMFKDKNSTTIVFIHGGPQTAYGHIYYIEFQYFYSNGYNILYTNPPGSTGYGQEYEKECVGDWGGNDFEYIKKAMKFVVNKYGISDSFALTGGSYGGFMTNWIVTHSNIFKCAISERSISNLLSMIGTSDIGFWFNSLQMNIKDPYSKEGMKKLMEYSPITYVKNVKTPVLLITGEEDYRCPIEQAEQFFVGLKLNMVDSELIRYQGDNHEHARAGVPNNMVDRLERKLAWFNKYMKN
ncbi:MAG: S9 family peptidase [Ferroplasma sp.]|uniref:alpha/beta hydrolase family protein n=1 Tax=Ferroplasma sp. TaxID=2591003 RepID=UPI002815C8C4|nr:S9 family peptidase [Ferroplasma sp.]WMT51693.1 MAG: S9 family peptidase [Ferroplasma sp.]